MKLHKFKGERGSISYIFVLVLFLLIGSMGFSFMLGNHIAEQVRLQNTADSSSLAIGAHASSGLNMIAVNNQAIAAAIQINHSLLLIAHYHLIAEALMSTTADIVGDIVEFASSPTRENRYQRVLTRYHKAGALYMQTAVGATVFNNKLKDYWLIPAAIKGIEMARLNFPGAIASPKQAGHLPFAPMSYKGLSQFSVKDTLCMVSAVKPDGSDVARDDFVSWLTGPLYATEKSPLPSEIGNSLHNLISMIHKILPLRLGFSKCGLAAKSPFYAFLDKGTMEKSIDFPPGFGNVIAEKLRDPLVGKTNHALEYCVTRPAFQKLIGAEIIALNSPFTSGNLYTSIFLQKIREGKAKDVPVYYANDTISICENYMKDGDMTTAVNDQGNFSECANVYLVTPDSFMCPVYEGIADSLPKNCTTEKNILGIPDGDDDKPRKRFKEQYGAECQKFFDWQNASKPHLSSIHTNNDPPSLIVRNLGNQAKAFEGRTKSSGFGFLVITNDDKYREFDKSLNFQSMVMSPHYSAKEVKKIWKEACSNIAFSKVANSAEFHCSLDTSSLMSLVTPSDANSGPESSETALDLSGAAKFMQGGADQMDGVSLLRRSRWAMSASHSRYQKLSEFEPDLFGKVQNMQIFWPGFGVSLRQAKYSDFLDSNLLSKTVDFLTGKSDD